MADPMGFRPEFDANQESALGFRLSFAVGMQLRFGHNQVVIRSKASRMRDVGAPREMRT